MAQSSTNPLQEGRRPTVLVGRYLADSLLEVILEQAEQWGWKLLSLEFFEEGIPSDFVVDGALMDCLPDSAIAKQLRARHCPAVRFGSFVHPQDLVLPAVLPDLSATGKLAAEHFFSRRFRNMAFISYASSDPTAPYHLLRKGFRERAQELGASCYDLDFNRPGDAKMPRHQRLRLRQRTIAAWIDALPKPVAILTAGDGMALYIFQSCTDANILIPDDVAVLGIGNRQLCRLAEIPLSSIELDLPHQMRIAMQLLRRLMSGETAPTHAVMVPPAGVIERRSTDVLAVHDPIVSIAIQYIWDHIPDDPTVAEVAAVIQVERRSLERAFRREIGSGVKAEVRRRRLELYCRELRTSDEPIATLSAKMGYQSQETMHRQFRKKMGMTPDQYRRQSR